MEDYSEKRQYDRRDCLKVAHLYRYDAQTKYYDTDAYYDSTMYNYSEGGGYLQTKEKMEIGQQVYLKIKIYDQTNKGPEKYDTYTGYVRWSNDLGTSSPSEQYGYGVQYENPVYY